jgi:hypothetical protein
MQFDYPTVSEFKSILTGLAHDFDGHTEHSGLRPLKPKPVFFKNASDATAERIRRVANMRERLKPKDELLFAPMINGRLKVQKPFRVRLSGSTEGVSACAEEIEEFGFGANRGEALDDLATTIGELYLSLRAERGRLSGHLASLLQVLEEHIVQVHA